jgi:hypothetical protein
MSNAKEKSGSSAGLGSISPINVLNAARRAVPAVDFALGVAGVAAAGALVTAFLGSGRAPIIILGGMLVAMLLLFVFSRLVAAQSPAITSAGVFLLWAVTLFFCAFLIFTITAVAVGWPAAWKSILGIETQAKAEPLGPEIVVLDKRNVDGVENNPKAPTRFTINKDYYITYIENYHWNYGRGLVLGSIGLRHDNGTMYGPWEVRTSSGQGGAPNVNWACNPNVRIPAGTYTVIDSDVATWSQNSKSGGMGITFIRGREAI